MRSTVLLTSCAAIAVLSAAPGGAAPAKPAAKPAAKAPAKAAAKAPAKASEKPNAGPGAAASAKKPGPDLPSTAPAGAPYAVVNGEPVSMARYIDRLSLRFGPEARELLVNEVLLRQEARRRKITATPEEIEATARRAYSETVRRYGDEQRLAEELKQSRGWTLGDYKAVIRSEADIQVLQEKIAAALVAPEAIKPEEVKSRYETHRSQFTLPAAVSITHILIKRSPDGAPEKEQAARKKAEDLLAKVQAASGANFEQTARESSEDRATGGRGGKIPSEIVRGSHPFGAEFEAVVFNAPVGIVGQIIPTSWGYHVIRVDAKSEERLLPLEEVQEQVREAILAERRRQKLDELFVRLRSTATVQTGKF